MKTINNPLKAYFSYGVDQTGIDDALYYELQDLRKSGESKWYWISAEFIIDKIKKTNGILLYWVRRKGQRKDKAVILQSDWKGMKYLQIYKKNKAISNTSKRTVRKKNVWYDNRLTHKEEKLYQDKKCWQCFSTKRLLVKLKKRKTPPRTADRYGKEHYDYWQCPKCKISYAYLKKIKSIRTKNNPPRGAVRIYDNILAIEAKKGKNSMWPNELFRHNFKAKKGKAAIYGLPDGSLLIKGKKKLWKKFNYPNP